jgi:hypothetical protein
MGAHNQGKVGLFLQLQREEPIITETTKNKANK